MDELIDKTIHAWIAELVVMRPKADLIKKLFPSLEFPNSTRLEIVRILRSISDEVSEGSVSEKILDHLESIEALGRKEGTSILASMKSAYCAVAVECAVKYLAGSWGMNWKFFDAVKRIFLTRIKNLELSGESELVCSSNGLVEWREKIEAAIWNSEVCDELLEKNTRNDALRLVREYLGDALAILGPPFLEVAVQKVKETEVMRKGEEKGKGKEVVVEEVQNTAQECNDERVVTVHTTKPLSYAEPESSGAIPDVVFDDAILDHDKQKLVDKDANGVNQVEVEIGTGSDGGADGQRGAARSPNLCRETVVCDRVADKRKECTKENAVPKLKQVARVKRRKGPVKVVSSEELDEEQSFIENKSISTNKYNKVREDLHTSILELKTLVTDPLPHALQVAKALQAEMIKKNMNHKTEGHPHEKEKNTCKPSDNGQGDIAPDGSNLSANINTEPSQMKEVIQGNQCLNLQNKAADQISMHRICSIPELGSDGMGTSLNASKPDEIDKKNMIHETPVTQENENDTHAAKSSAKESSEHVQNQNNLSANGNAEPNQEVVANRRDQCLNLRNHPPKCSLMERNSTAHTCEWDDSIDASPEGESSRIRSFRLSTPKRKVASPLKKYEPTKLARRRTVRKWSLEEEDVLRKAVQKYGKGHWKLILRCHDDVFAERTEVDLKDKWRNMERYPVR